MRIRGKVTPERYVELRDALEAWLDSIPESEKSDDDDVVDIGGMVAFYRIDD